MDQTYSPRIWKKEETILVKLPYEDFDSNASHHFRVMIDNLITRYSCLYIILDFSSIVLIDSTGLASIVYALNKCTENNLKLVLCSLRENVHAQVKARGITSLLDVYSNIHSALDSATQYIALHQRTSNSTPNVFGFPMEEKITYNQI